MSCCCVCRLFPYPPRFITPSYSCSKHCSAVSLSLSLSLCLSFFLCPLMLHSQVILHLPSSALSSSLGSSSSLCSLCEDAGYLCELSNGNEQTLALLQDITFQVVTHTHTHTHKHTHTHTHKMQALTCTHTHAHNMHTCMHTRMHIICTHIHT